MKQGTSKQLAGGVRQALPGKKGGHQSLCVCLENLDSLLDVFSGAIAFLAGSTVCSNVQFGYGTDACFNGIKGLSMLLNRTLVVTDAWNNQVRYEFVYLLKIRVVV
jgi:hypothetical protein